MPPFSRIDKEGVREGGGRRRFSAAALVVGENKNRCHGTSPTEPMDETTTEVFVLHSLTGASLHMELLVVALNG